MYCLFYWSCFQAHHLLTVLSLTLFITVLSHFPLWIYNGVKSNLTEIFIYHRRVPFFPKKHLLCSQTKLATKCDSWWMFLNRQLFSSIFLAHRLNPALHLPAVILEKILHKSAEIYTVCLLQQYTHTYAFPFLSCAPLQHTKHLKLAVNSPPPFSWGNSPPLRTAQVKKLNFTHRAIKNNLEYLKLSGENPP